MGFLRFAGDAWKKFTGASGLPWWADLGVDVINPAPGIGMGAGLANTLGLTGAAGLATTVAGGLAGAFALEQLLDPKASSALDTPEAFSNYFNSLPLKDRERIAAAMQKNEQKYGGKLPAVTQAKPQPKPKPETQQKREPMSPIVPESKQQPGATGEVPPPAPELPAPEFPDETQVETPALDPIKERLRQQIMEKLGPSGGYESFGSQRLSDAIRQAQQDIVQRRFDVELPQAETQVEQAAVPAETGNGSQGGFVEGLARFARGFQQGYENRGPLGRRPGFSAPRGNYNY